MVLGTDVEKFAAEEALKKFHVKMLRANPVKFVKLRSAMVFSIQHGATDRTSGGREK